ncbi:hypothetical protein BG004_008275 [Podila humilis]|nr:hypothetical protein BG004_008275 [Podila humilis]
MASTPPTTSAEEDSILSFLTTDFLESQSSPFDANPFFESLSTEALLHPPSPPTSIGTYSESSGSPHNSNIDSCDEGSSSDVNMDANPLEYWQYAYPDLQSSIPFPILPDDDLQQQHHQLPLESLHQPGAWPSIASMNTHPLFQAASPGGYLHNNNNNIANNFINGTHTPTSSSPSSTPSTPPRKNSRSSMPTPPSPASSIKAEKQEKRTKRAKKQPSTAPQQTTLPPLAPLVPLAPLKPLISLAPQPTPLSPPTSIHDTFIKQSPPLSPCILPALALTRAPTTTTTSTTTTNTNANTNTNTNTNANTNTSAANTNTNAPAPIRRQSIVPALTPSLVRSNPVVVKSSLIPEKEPQSDAVLTAQAKRQERLIKNRAAALLSRKRKREHINLLESHTDLLKLDNQELKERVCELEENVKILTEERDAARTECERLRHQVKASALASSHRPSSYVETATAATVRLDLDLERNLRNHAEAERGLNSKATGVVFMIILFSFALFNLPSGKLETLMVGGGSLNRPRIGATIVGRALDSYTKNPTISGQVREASSGTARQDLNNMTDLVVFSDNRALQAWLGHEPVTISKNSARESAAAATSTTLAKDATIPVVVIAEVNNSAMEPTAVIAEETTKSVGFVAQNREHRSWPSPVTTENRNEPDRDALLYCANLLYSLDHTTVTRESGPNQSTNGEIRRPRLSIISPLDGVVGSSQSNREKKGQHLPPWMPNREPSEDELEQRYLRLDVEVTSSRVVSGKSLENHEQVIRFPLMPVGGMFDNSTTSLVPSSKVPPPLPTPVSTSNTSAPSIIGRRRMPSSSSSSSSANERRRGSGNASSGRVSAQGGVTKTRRTYDSKAQFYKVTHDVPRPPPASQSSQDYSVPLASIKEEPMEVETFIKEEPMD